MLLAFAACNGQIVGAEILPFASGDQPDPVLVGAKAVGLTAGDCTGDDLPDLIVAAQNSNNVDVLRNLGDGRLEAGGGSVVVSQAMGAACADFNGDGLIDIAAVGRNGDISFFFRDATDNLTLAGTRQAGTVPTALIAGDLNGDGVKDLVAVDSASEDVAVLLSTGTNALPAFVRRFRTPISRPHAAAIADFDHDGFPDIAVAGNTEPFIVILYGNNLGFTTRENTFPFSQTQSPKQGRGIASADLNGDGNEDLALLSSDGVVTLFLGSASGQFSFLDAFSVSSGSEAIALADLSGDGLLDIALVNSETNSVQVLLATAVGKFDLEHVVQVSTVSNGLGSTTSRSVLTDASDPLTNLTQLVSVNGPGKALMLVEQADPTQLSTTVLASLGNEPVHVTLGDLNNDAVPDAALVVRNPAKKRELQLQILLGTADGQYVPVAQQGFGTCGNGILEAGEQCDDRNLKAHDGCKVCRVEVGRAVPSLSLADLNGDTFNDIVFTDDRGQVWALYSDGQGRFKDVELLGVGRRKTPAAVADFNGDGLTDVLLVSKRTRDGFLTLLANAGDGTFTTTPLAVKLPVVGPLLAADFDRDGLTDVAAGYKGGWAVLYNTGDGPMRVSASPLSKAFKVISGFAAADFDEDGWFDVLATFESAKVPSLLFRGSAIGTFLAGEAVDSSERLINPYVVDLDQDNHQDIASCTETPTFSCRVLYGNGTGRFGAAALPSSSAVGRSPRGVRVADFDHDGYSDIVGVSYGDHLMAIIYGGGGTQPSGRATFDTGRVPTDVEVLDLNGDGLDDIVVGNSASRDLSIFVNQGDRHFLALEPLLLPRLSDSGLGIIKLAAGDLNGDGVTDLAAVQAGGNAGGTVTPLINVAGVGLAAFGSLPVGHDAWGIALGHINTDDKLDIAVSNRADNTFSVLLSQPDGTYLRTDYPGGGNRTTSIAVADLNGDSFDDIVTTNEWIDANTKTYGNVASFLNNGTGGFGAAAFKDVRGRVILRGICAGDFDNDGAKDVAVASIGTSDIMVLFGAGNGGWRTDARLFSVGDAPISVSCSDYDQDGKINDIAFGRQKGSEVGLIHNSD